MNFIKFEETGMLIMLRFVLFGMKMKSIEKVRLASDDNIAKSSILVTTFLINLASSFTSKKC